MSFASIVLLCSWSTAVTASNTVPATNVLSSQYDPAVDVLAPIQCENLGMSQVQSGDGAALSSTNAPTLLMGGPADNVMTGGDGNDCLLGGDGADTLDGGAGVDVCIGQGGIDTLAVGCETVIQ